MYKIILKKNATKFIDRLPASEKKRLLSAIEKLPNCKDTKKLRGYEDIYRLRVGTYRVIYSVNNSVLTVIVVAVGNRGEVYSHFASK